VSPSSEVGHAAAEACADRAGDAFKAAAFSAFCEFAVPGRKFLTEDVREFSKIAGHDDRAWGNIAKRALQFGAIRKAGFSSAKSSNGSPKTLWEGVTR
jgi:hypothetical protein